jgi:hypothetical protein
MNPVEIINAFAINQNPQLSEQQINEMVNGEEFLNAIMLGFANN